MKHLHILFVIALVFFVTSCAKELEYFSSNNPHDNGSEEENPLDSERVSDTIKVITLEEAGTLNNVIGEDDRLKIRELKLSGPVNGSDLRVIREMAGSGMHGEATEGCLHRLDLSKAKIVKGGESYIYDPSSVDLFIKENDVIPRFAFGYCHSLQEIILPNDVVSLESQGFYECDALVNISIPKTVKRILKSCFYNCKSLVGTIVWPENQTTVYEYTFDGCENLSNVVWHDNITSIGDFAFYNCNNLPMPKLDYISYYGVASFYNCKMLTQSFTQPANMDYVPEGAFYGTGITSFKTGKIRRVERIAFYRSSIQTFDVAMIADSICQYAFQYTPLQGEIVFSPTLKYIGENAFGKTNVTKVTVNSDIAHLDLGIYSGTFRECENLSAVYVADGVKKLQITFDECKSLCEVRLPESLEQIGDETNKISMYGFYNCTALKNITLPKNLRFTAYAAFAGCTSLESITIPASLKGNGGEFMDCTSLKNVTFEDGLAKIPYHMFEGCTSLTSVTLPNSITAIDNSVFEGCSKLRSVNIGNRLETLGEKVFYKCSALKTINLPQTIKRIEYATFRGCAALNSIALPDNLEYIANEAFYNCTSLTDVSFGNSLTEIGDYGFYGCRFENILFPNTLRTIGESAFSNSYLKQISIPEGVKTVSISMLAKCSLLSSVTLPSTISSIQNNAFEGCVRLQSLTINATTPPTLGTDVFGNVPVDKLTINVPSSALDVYKNNQEWGKYMK